MPRLLFLLNTAHSYADISLTLTSFFVKRQRLIRIVTKKFSSFFTAHNGKWLAFLCNRAGKLKELNLNLLEKTKLWFIWQDEWNNNNLRCIPNLEEAANLWIIASVQKLYNLHKEFEWILCLHEVFNSRFPCGGGNIDIVLLKLEI